MNQRFNLPNSPAPIAPMVYVKDRTIWQYRVLTGESPDKDKVDEQKLNELGREGWELAATLIHNGSVHFYFKRVKE